MKNSYSVISFDVLSLLRDAREYFGAPALLESTFVRVHGSPRGILSVISYS